MRERAVLTMEAAMARMFPAVCPATRSGGAAVTPAERQLFARLARELDANWQVVHDCRVRAGGATGALDYVLLHRDYGVALLGVASPGSVEDPEAAVAAMRALLERIGFAQRYHGYIAIIARNVVPGAISDLAAFLALRFAAVPASAIADPTWTDWLLQRLVAERDGPQRVEPAAAARPEPAPRGAERGLRAPTAEDSWRARAADKPSAAAPPRRPAASPPGMRVAPERIAVSRVAETRSPLWAGMALAVVVVSVVLVGIAVLSHGNGGREAMMTQSASTPPQAAPAAPDAPAH